MNIWAESPEDDDERTVEGVIVQIKRGNKKYITIEDNNGRKREYEIDNDARFFLDDEEVTLADLKIDLEVELTIKDGIVYEIRAED